MNIQKVFYNDHGQLRTSWKILIFITFLFIAISPLILVNNSYLQFSGAVIILICGLYLNAEYLDKRSFLEYGLKIKKETLLYFLMGTLIGVFSVITMVLIGKVSGILLVSDFLSIPKLSVLFLFTMKMLLVSILEETFFRGYLFTNLYDGFKSKKITNKQASIISIGLSSLLFGVAHVGNDHVSILSIVMLTINGIVWCIPFVITRNLGLPIGLHFAWNFTQTSIGFTMSGNKAVNSFYKIENNGSDLLTGGGYGPEAGILGLIGFIMMLLLSLKYLNLIGKINQLN